jgi:peptide/nickel transport system permease protein
MNPLSFALRKLLASIPLLIGVTFVSFLLMVYLGPDISYVIVGKNATPEEIERVRHLLGYDQPFLMRYLQFLQELITLDFGNTFFSGEPVSTLLARSIPISLALLLPGFVLGNAAGIALAMVATRHRGRWPDRLIMGVSVIGMSISFLIAVIVFQILFSSNAGLGWFPVQGWRVDSVGDYLYYVFVPTVATIFVTVGYNTRFYRAVLVEEFDRDHVRTGRAYGAGEARLLAGHVLRNCAIPIITRIVFSIPLIVVSGSLILEKYFNVPGVGRVAFDAIASGDQPVLKAIVSLTAVLFVLMQALAEILYAAFDPRVKLA